MSRLARHPKIIQLAHHLGLPWRGDCLARVREFALAEVQRLTEGITIASINDLLRVLCARLSVRLEFIRSDEDLGRIGREYGFDEVLHRQLLSEFVPGGTEGWVIHHPNWRPGERRYVVVVDARGARAPRAYFTAWHEIAHLIVTPPQHVFAGFRRVLERRLTKDPIEAVVDHIAGELAYFEPLFGPVLDEEIAQDGELTFRAIDAARERFAPEASLFSAATASVRLSTAPVAFVHVELALKQAEQERLLESQPELPLPGLPGPSPSLRATTVIASSVMTKSGFCIFAPMRVPERSILARVFEAGDETRIRAIEDQRWWETRKKGFLPPLQLCVAALRRGDYVYGLLSAV